MLLQKIMALPLLGFRQPVLLTTKFKMPYLNYKDTLSCNLSDTIMVTLNPIPSPFFTVPNRICETSSINPLIPRTTGGTFSGLGVLSTNFNATDPKVKPSLNTPNGVIIKHSISKLNCNADTSIMVLVYPQFDTVYSGIREFCETDALEILTTRHSGGAWTGPGVSAKSFNPALAGAGSLTIKVDSTGFCGNSANYQFLVSKMPDHDFPDTIYGCNNKAAILDAGNNGSAYLWNTNDTSQKITAIVNGDYWVKITDGKCELSDSTFVKITELCLGVSAFHSSKSTIKIFPNPTSQYLNLKSEGEKIESVKLLNLMG